MNIAHIHKVNYLVETKLKQSSRSRMIRVILTFIIFFMNNLHLNNKMKIISYDNGHNTAQKIMMEKKHSRTNRASDDVVSDVVQLNISSVNS